MAHAAAPLNNEDIQHFINAMKPLQSLGEKYPFDEDFDAHPDSPAGESTDAINFSPMSRALAKVKDHPSFEEFKTIVLRAGFTSPQQWATVGDRIMRAYTSLKVIEGMTPEKIQELMKTIEEVKKNEYLSPKMKKRLLASLTQTITTADTLPARTKADQETLKPYLARLERLFEEQP